ncbi:hypothetical protein TRAPUB_9965 [Trametes pubescens]|uniref:Transmembrane protein n=1 Tax=Trametes pubescens TaxID=154538 RepID=A0A1M2W144_TRAPU|nr:hypothetical protein TRAPUB_9965 [Trametes pubescens]
MSAGFLVEKSSVHRRGLAGGVRRLNKRWVYTPTAIFTTATDILLPTTTSDPVAAPNATVTTSAIVPTTTSTTNVNPVASTTSLSTAVAPSTPATTSATVVTPVPTTTSASSVVPITTQQQQQQQATTTPAATRVPSTTTRTVADALTEVTQTLTSTRPGSAAAASSAIVSPSASTTPTSTTSPGLVAGGIIAAVVGVAGILFAVVYFIRRSRKTSDDEDDGNEFNAQAFRRQSVVLQDDNYPVMSRAMTVNRNGNTPRPPTMIERKMANTPAPYDVPAMSHPYGYSGAYGQPSFAPGQIMSPGPYTPTSVNSTNPFFSPYGESPIGTPVSVAAYNTAYTEDGHAISRQPSNGSSAILSRQPSSAALPTPPSVEGAQYVDLSRSSVTPFQAAQYVEISRRLNTNPPQPLPASEVAEVAEELAEHDGTAPVLSPRPVEPLELQPTLSFDEPRRFTVQPTPKESAFPESPFADPTMSFHEEQLQHAPERDSFPMPPSPTYSSKSRVTSKPPTLPEIQIQQRPFSPVSLDFPLVPSTPHVAPSPLGSTFSMPSPPADAHFSEPASPATPVPRGQVVPMSKRPDTVYTLYDEDDAYAGI